MIDQASGGGFSVKISVPEGSDFVPGDNRDYSNGSRMRGFVAEEKSSAG